MPRTAVVAAMHEELRALLPLLAGATRIERAGRSFHVGTLGDHDAVLVLSGIGKVAAAATTALLAERFDVAQVVFTGVAGGLADGVAIGDIVVASECLQHDLDASPLFPRFEVPLTGRARFAADAALAARVAEAARRCATEHPFAGRAPAVHRGLVVSGDRFVATAAESAALRALLPDALAVEMEGAAVAQVCADFALPFAVVRTVSDRADDSAHVDFARFIADVASVATRSIVAHWLGLGA